MPTNLYEAAWIFLIYAFLGWICEVSFAALELGKFVNRGFLNGPVCPIYGVGMLAVVSVLWPIRKNALLLIFGAAVLTTAIEFITGFFLEKVFHTKWWDYSDMPFNIKGYICLKFTVLWGLAAALVVGAVHPFLYLMIRKTPFQVGIVFMVLFFLVFAVDLLITVAALIKLPRKLNAMLELEKTLNILADKIGGNVSEVTIAAANKKNELMEENKPKLLEWKAEYAKKVAEYKRLANEWSFVHLRIFKAFPKLKSGRYKTIFERLASIKALRQGEKHESDQL